MKKPLARFLTSAHLYQSEDSGVQPYAKELVSWPAAGSSPAALERCVATADAEWLSCWQRHLLRPSSEVAALRRESKVKRPYCDPGLVRRPATYADVLATLDSRGMLDWTDRA